MAKNERTHPTPAKLAAKGLRGEHLTKKENLRVYGSLLTQTPDKKRR